METAGDYFEVVAGLFRNLILGEALLVILGRFSKTPEMIDTQHPKPRRRAQGLGGRLGSVFDRL